MLDHILIRALVPRRGRREYDEDREPFTAGARRSLIYDGKIGLGRTYAKIDTALT